MMMDGYTDMIFKSLWYITPLILIIGLIKTPWFKGKLGELQVNLLIRLFLPSNQYELLKNITLPTEDGTTQIDHVIVSRYGIFVLETKNMSGWIFGKENQKQWTQQIFKQKYKFQNPLHQNYKHLKTLEANFGIPEESLHSVIVFIGDSTFKNNMPDNVTFARGAIEYIKSFQKVVYTNDQLLELIMVINGGTKVRGFKTDREHVTHVKDIVAKKHEKPKAVQSSLQPPQRQLMQPAPVCLKCGSDMIERVTKQGSNKGQKFLGCSTFPRCRSMAKIV